MCALWLHLKYYENVIEVIALWLSFLQTQDMVLAAMERGIADLDEANIVT